MPQFVVVKGSMMKCAVGTNPNVLFVTSQQCMKIDDLPVATIMDHVPMANIGSFGICQIKTDLASGVPQPCIPMTPAPWSPGSTVQKIDGLPVLTAPATCACDIGGVITIQDSIQEMENSD